MKKLYIFAAIFFAAFYFLFSLLKKEPHKGTTSLMVEEAGADGPAASAEFEYLKTRDPVTGEVPREKLDLARQVQLQKFARQKAARQTVVPGISWTERGPDNIGGRTRAVLYDLNDPTGRKVWAGGVGGGLWYTNDITATPTAWTKVSDTLNNLAITCITQGRSPTVRNKLFFGTGEGWFNYDAIRGNGIWRSLDGGATWTQLPFTKNNPDFRFVQDIVYVDVGPCGISPESVIAATSRGVFRSTNNGDTWTKVLGLGIAGATLNAAADLEQEYYYVFATLGLADAGGGGIYRSCDGGATWDQIYHAEKDEQRIELSAHYLDAWQVYAVVQDSFFRAKKIMKTSNADTNPPNAVRWFDKPLPSFCNLSGASEFTNGQAWYDLIIAVAPFFRDPPANDHFFTVYVGGVDLNKSIDSGKNWSQVSEWNTGCGHPYVHADKHNLVFKPDPVNGGFFPNEFLVASDGGIGMSTNGGVSYTAKNKSYNITQFYSCAFHPTLANYFLAGSQDNGTQKFSSPGMNSTSDIVPNDHDGGYCFIDQDNPSVQIATYVFNQYFISTNDGASFTYTPKNTRGQFINPMDYDNANNILYAGDDVGSYYRWTNPGGGGADQQVSVTAFNGAKITFVVLSPTVPNRVYFGLDNGSVVRVDDANTGSTKAGLVIRPDVGANVFLSCIAVDPTNENHMLISYSNYNLVSVYESSLGTGGSLDWAAVDVNSASSSLPDMPVRWCMFDPRNSNWAILATEMGIWSTDHLNRAATVWEPTNDNLANTRIDMLRYRSSDRLLLAATHGRGLFSTTIPAGTALPVTLMDFSGRLQNNEVWLNWSTAAEYNSKLFQVERSTDGIKYEDIGSVPAAGNSNTRHSYSYYDPYLSQENNYYRLKQIDRDGKFDYSGIVVIKNPVRTKEALALLSNPFVNSIDLQFGAIAKGRSTISLYDMKGALILRKHYNVEPVTRLRINLDESLTHGEYLLEVVVGNNRYVTRLIKK